MESPTLRISASSASLPAPGVPCADGRSLSLGWAAGPRLADVSPELEGGKWICEALGCRNDGPGPVPAFPAEKAVPEGPRRLLTPAGPSLPGAQAPVAGFPPRSPGPSGHGLGRSGAWPDQPVLGPSGAVSLLSRFSQKAPTSPNLFSMLQPYRLPF